MYKGLKQKAKSLMTQKAKPTTKKKIKQSAVHAALDLAAEQGWENVDLKGIAKHAKLNLSDLHDYFDDKFDILAAYGRMVDKQVLENATAGELDNDALSCRDRLFDILMDRFDTLNDHRAGVISVLDAFKYDPKHAVISLPHLGRSMTWMLEAAGIPTNGIKGSLKIAGLTGLYLKVLRVWVKDDSVDMGKTMSALDKGLGHAEEWSNTFGLL